MTIRPNHVCLFAVMVMTSLTGQPGAFARSPEAPAPPSPGCTRAAIADVAQRALAKVQGRAGQSGVTLSVYLPTRFKEPVSLASGWSDFDAKLPMTPASRMLAGSIGKTLYAAAALKLADLGQLDLDKTIADYMPGADVPNAHIVTIRNLLSHTSGYGEYDEAFIRALIAEPQRPRTLEDWVGPLKRNAPTQPGTFRYSDINFVILAQVIDAVAPGSATDFIKSEFLRPYRLNDTVASDHVRLDHLVPGYAGPNNFFGRDAMMDQGRLIYNPQFESGGGGFMTTSDDLSRWIALFSLGNFFSQQSWQAASRPVHIDSKTGKGYGLGIHVDPTPAGTAYGHSGYIPGYYSWARWYPEANAGIAVQTNSSDDARVPWDGYDVTNAIALDLKQRCNS